MVQRYNPDYVMHAARFEPFARENEHGEFVKFSDYEVLKAERDALAVERDAARNALASIYKTVTGELPEWSNWHAYLEDIVEEVGAAIAANQAADALAVENAALNKSLDDVCDAYENGQRDLLSEAIDKAINLPAPATSAALAAIRNEATVRALKHLCDCQLISATVAELKAEELREAK
ncbi:hypothetical protein [Serratia marcescens]|uniref:hypothetical protein n=1 Tax=Serratia marcescens TaxID=615 RepID=UPI000A198FAE|nr:hypothetical protein [Serratia marcescens]